MLPDKPILLTTGQAARLCAVTPDAVLKWIKKGHLRGVRTAGGHYRIDRRDLGPFLAKTRTAIESTGRPDGWCRRNLRCWEYLSDRGVIREECRSCVVHQVGASRCYLMAGMEAELGHARQFCRGSCEDCVYYRRLNGLAANVLVVTSDEEFIVRLTAEESDRIALRFAQNAYEASAVIHDFRPALAVLDSESGRDVDTQLADWLATDPRVPGLRIIVAVPAGMKARRQRSARPETKEPIIAVLEKPFGPRRIVTVIDSFHAHFATPEGDDLFPTARGEPR